jgi:hypothetical protein
MPPCCVMGPGLMLIDGGKTNAGPAVLNYSRAGRAGPDVRSLRMPMPTTSAVDRRAGSG